MDDKLINLIVTVVIIGIWVVQFLFKAKPQEQERQFDEDDEYEAGNDRPRNTYAEDPYIKVQEEIRRKIAERKAAEQAAAQTKQTQPQSRPLVAKQEQRPAASVQQRPAQAAPSQQARQAQSIDEIRRRRELVEQGMGRQSNVTIDRELRPIPSAQLPSRAFPTAQSNSAQKAAFPAAARSSHAAYQGSTKLRRQANQRNVELKETLRRSGSTRQAVLLREILGEPVGLRDDERRF